MEDTEINDLLEILRDRLVRLQLDLKEKGLWKANEKPPSSNWEEGGDLIFIRYHICLPSGFLMCVLECS